MTNDRKNMIFYCGSWPHCIFSYFTYHIMGDSIVKFFGKNRLGEVAKEAFSSGVETTFPCEQITIDVTSFGELLYQRRSQRRPKQKRDLYSTECILESQKTNRPRREAPRRNVMESKHTEAAPGRSGFKEIFPTR